MPLQLFQLIHVVGILLLFAGLGSLLTKYTKLGAALHGSGLLLILLSGLDHARLHQFPAWVWVKLLIWLLLGAALVVAKRELLPKGAAWAVVIALGFAAAWLGSFKPF